MVFKIRLGIFIFVCVLIFGVMLYSKESQIIKTLNIPSFNIETIENQRTKDGIVFKTTLSPEEIINKTNAKICDKQNLENEGLEIYYCFVENINNFVVSEGKKINLQISFDGKISSVGFPLILSGY